MKGYIGNIEEVTLENNDFRRVIYTGQHSQLVVMSLKPGEDIGEEVHDLDQFIRIESGQGRVILDGAEYEVKDDFAVVVPAGSRHNVINDSGEAELKLYTLYSPPEHKDKVVHRDKADAERDEDDHFDGRVTEQ